MAKVKTLYLCQSCGYESQRWMGRCPDCGEWNTFVEEVKTKKTSKGVSATLSQKPLALNQIQITEEARISTGMPELDRVLGGGIVQGSLILVGGDPGIGKSTLLLQICQQIGKKNHTVLYVSGEESMHQVKMRADRLCVDTSKLLLLTETNVDIIEKVIHEIKPEIVIIDSIQTVFQPEVSSAPGSVSQVREATSTLMRLAKGLSISILIVGHVTKEGSIAGPRVLEHMVDTVLYFEGERHISFRILRAVKNRFGSTNEIGVFEMSGQGLKEVANPSELMLSGRPIGEAGSIVTCSMEGTRPMLIEIQALVSPTTFGMPRRTATGIDYNRVVLLMAVLEKKIGMQLANYDSYVNLAGGIKIAEPALDLGVIVAIASSYRNQAIDPHVVVFGEVGLTGEIRGVTMAEKRIVEAEKMGFTKCILPEANKKNLMTSNKIQLYGVSNVNNVLDIIRR
ncbi:MAG: DNA repair protein RadA [Epulopiscium sp.]|nr:DNA repair protein RadA [Candidatus Epulonipiscium sp.]